MNNVKAGVLLGVGYWLFYSAVAQGGAFALSPWQALSGPGSAA